MVGVKKTFADVTGFAETPSGAVPIRFVDGSLSLGMSEDQAQVFAAGLVSAVDGAVCFTDGTGVVECRPPSDMTAVQAAEAVRECIVRMLVRNNP